MLAFFFVFGTGFTSTINNEIPSNDEDGPCFIIVETRHSDGTRTLHGSVYTGESGCSGTAVLTIAE
ncbi:hypothetical protein [Gelidibacter algens]|nr:hypothetical protein [Gelidibacter algens]OBX24851.1 hypothetical protein A9996_13250 [Gelidibacter algens]